MACIRTVSLRLANGSRPSIEQAATTDPSHPISLAVQMMSDKVYLIDSSIYVFRAWFTVPDHVVNQDNEPVNAVYGFADFVYQFLQQTQPRYIAFAFDDSLKSCFRNQLYPEYKANREPAPEELKRQFAYCREFLQASGLFETARTHYEADDVIGTLAKQMRARGHPITIVTADKDLAQLIFENDILWNFAKGQRHSIPQIKKQFGVYPDQIADQLAIAGDKVDNIQGTPGIGMATAAKLLNRFSSLEGLLANYTEIGSMNIRGAKRIQNLIENHKEHLPLYKKLTTIHCDINFSDTLSLKRKSPDFAALEKLFDKFGFSRFRRERWLNILQA